LDEVTQQIREAVELCLEVAGAPEQTLEFVGIQRITIAA
jgi:predicted RNase H-like HicB family nuclease